ncbi:MAG: Na(+)-translocating NADH-quinone reductase subunit C, partial [Litorivicinus sp.]
MSSNNDSIKKTLTVALSLCIVCSVVVSGAAVSLRSQQQFNAEAERKRNIVQAAGVYDAAKPITEQFKQFETRVVDLSTGLYVDWSDEEIAAYDQRKAASEPATSRQLDKSEDIASIRRQANYASVYLYDGNQDGEADRVVLPIHGYGLWSTLYGFMALESDVNTVAGLTFYSHAETPGLGGEVDNPAWKAQWVGKNVYDDGEVALRLV